MNYNSFDNVGFVKVLYFLKSHNSEYLSGQDLSEVLKISRVAVWKHIKKIKKLGYKIDSKQKFGYRLLKNSNVLFPWEILDGLETNYLGKKIYFFDSINSTQNFASRIIQNGKENGTLVIAQKQTHGRGRMKRKWISPLGGLWFSLIIQPKFKSMYATLFPMLSSLALAIAIEKIFHKKPSLKWPNDVLLNGKKVAGSLIDLEIESTRLSNLVLGVGINFNINRKIIEERIKKSENFYGVATLGSQNNENHKKLLQVFLLELEKLIELLNKERPMKIIREWTKRSSTIGKTIKIRTEEGQISGRAKKIDHDGALVLINKNNSQRVLVGDVI